MNRAESAVAESMWADLQWLRRHPPTAGFRVDLAMTARAQRLLDGFHAEALAAAEDRLARYRSRAA